MWVLSAIWRARNQLQSGNAESGGYSWHVSFEVKTALREALSSPVFGQKDGGQCHAKIGSFTGTL